MRGSYNESVVRDTHVSVDVIYEGIVQPLSVLSYEDLVEQMKRLFFDTETMRLSYVDDEGDRISVMCAADFSEAVRVLSLSGGPTLRLEFEGTRNLPSADVEVAKSCETSQNYEPQTVLCDVEEENQHVTSPESCEKTTKAPSSPEIAAQYLASIERNVQANLREIHYMASLLEQKPSMTEPVDVDHTVNTAPNTVPVVVFVVPCKDENDESNEEAVEDSAQNIVGTCNGVSRKVTEQCMEVSTADMKDVSNSVSQKCQTLFDESCAATAKNSAHQAMVSDAESRDAVALVQMTADKLLDLQRNARQSDEALRRNQELADEVQRICASLSEETTRSCNAITQCISEMVRNT